MFELIIRNLLFFFVDLSVLVSLWRRKNATKEQRYKGTKDHQDFILIELSKK